VERLANLQAMVDKNPTNHAMRFGLAMELFKAEHYEQAIVQMERYLELHDDEGAAYRMLAAAAEKLGRTDAARIALRRGIDAAKRHGHPGMAEEFADRLEGLED
jgi:predicted Zn-dependent protease